MSLSAVGIYWLYQDFVVSSAEAKAVSLSESLVALEYDRLLQPDTQGSDQLMADKPALLKLDQMLKKFLEPYNILKIKVFSIDKEVVYSTDHSIIGQKNPTNARLDIALAGFNDSKMQTSEALYDLSNEIRFDVDVVETYVPIRNASGQVVGSFEIYLDTKQDNQKVAVQVMLSLAFLAAVIATIYTIAYLFLRTAVSQLTTAQKQLQRLASADGLTGLINHREINRLGENEFARFRRQNKHASFSLIMADLDDFKLVNDSLGHIAGDEMINAMGTRLDNCMRSGDLVARMGGDEFVVISSAFSSSDSAAATSSLIEAHRLNSPFIISDKDFQKAFKADADYAKGRPLNWQKIAGRIVQIRCELVAPWRLHGQPGGWPRQAGEGCFWVHRGEGGS